MHTDANKGDKIMNERIRRGMIGMATMAMIAALSACGGGGSGGDGCPTTEPTSCITGLSGNWDVSDVTSTSSEYCIDADGSTTTYTAEVTQSGCRLTVEIAGNVFAGFVDGSTLCWSGSYPFNDGTTTLTSMEVTANAAGTSFTGSASWTWTDGVGNCEGTSSSQGFKI